MRLLKKIVLILISILIASCSYNWQRRAEQVVKQVIKQTKLEEFLRGKPTKENNNVSINDLFTIKNSDRYYFHIYVQEMHPEISTRIIRFIKDENLKRNALRFSMADLNYLDSQIPTLKVKDALSIKDEIYLGKTVIILVRPSLANVLYGKSKFDRNSIEFNFIFVSDDNKVDLIEQMTVVLSGSDPTPKEKDPNAIIEDFYKEFSHLVRKSIDELFRFEDVSSPSSNRSELIFKQAFKNEFDALKDIFASMNLEQKEQTFEKLKQNNIRLFGRTNPLNQMNVNNASFFGKFYELTDNYGLFYFNKNSEQRKHIGFFDISDYDAISLKLISYSNYRTIYHGNSIREMTKIPTGITFTIVKI
jgi:hypothetical protein